MTGMTSRGTEPEQTRSITETIILITAVILLFVLLYLIAPTLSPFLITGAIVYLVYPIRQHFLVSRLIALTVAVFVLWLFITLAGVLTPFMVAFFIAYLFNPLVGMLERRGIKRWLASTLVLLGILAIVGTALTLFVPVVISQSGNIISHISSFAKNTVEYIKGGRLVRLLAQFGVPPEQAYDLISRELPSRLEGMLGTLLQAIVGFVTNVSSIISQLVNIVIIPFVSFYLLRDFPKFSALVTDALPQTWQRPALRYLREVDEVVGQYVRGTLLISALQGILTTIGLAIIGVQYAVLLGIITGILNIIPYVGFYSSLIFAVIAALVSGEPAFIKALSVVILYVGLNILETVVFSPKLVGNRVGLHPVVLIISLVVFGYFLGFIGMIIAVPATAVLLMTARLWNEKE